MDKKFLIKAITFNIAWLLWIALSVLFGYLIADACFPDNMLTIIPFSLVFLVAGGVPAVIIFRKLFKLSDKSASKVENGQHVAGKTAEESITSEADKSQADPQTVNAVSAADKVFTEKDDGDNKSSGGDMQV